MKQIEIFEGATHEMATAAANKFVIDNKLADVEIFPMLGGGVILAPAQGQNSSPLELPGGGKSVAMQPLVIPWWAVAVIYSITQ